METPLPPKKFLVFQEMELFGISGSSFLSSKNKKNLLLKSFLYFGEMKLFSPKMKKTSYISKISYTFPYTEAKFSKLKNFLIIIITRFFSFYNIFFYTQPAFIFHLLRYSTFTTILSLFFFFFFRKILISFTSFFLLQSFLIFLIIFT